VISLFAIIFFGFFLVGVLEIVEKGRGRDVAYDTHQRSLRQYSYTILFRRHLTSLCHVDSDSRFAVKSRWGYWTYKNIVLTTNLLLDLGQDTSGVVSCCSREPKGEKTNARNNMC
jgi:hypothetical protein